MNKIEIGSTILVSDKTSHEPKEIECLVLDIIGRKVSVMDDEGNSFTVSMRDVALLEDEAA